MRPSRRDFPAVFLLLVLFSCERRPLEDIESDFSFTPASVDFGSAFLGYPAARNITLTNRSRAERTLNLSLSGPFSTPVTELIVPGGGQLNVDIAFSPEVSGPARGALVFDGLGEVELTGTGVAPPDCASDVACQQSAFDSSRGECVQTNRENGSVCANTCIEGGTCLEGTCIGASMSCSDSDLCTLDSCDLTTGCQHAPVECAASTDPCKVGRCDPLLGCVQSDVRDGTACGPADCVTAQICLLGQCRALAVPDGTSCGEVSPCQRQGECQQSVCVRPPPTLLPETWGYTFPTTQASFAGVTDAAQNLYWGECTTTCALVSFSRDGVFRFRTPLGGPPSEVHHLIWGELVVWATNDSIGALSSLDGTARWSRQLPAALNGATDTADVLSVVALAGRASGIVVIAQRRLGTTPRDSALLELDGLTGATRFSRFEPHVSTPVIDEHGDLYVLIRPDSPFVATSDLLSLSASGTENWRLTVDGYSLLGAFGGEVLFDEEDLLVIGQATVQKANASGRVLGNVLMSSAGRMLVRQMFALTALPPSTQTPLWTSSLQVMHGTSGLSDIVATAGGGLLVAVTGSRHPTYLKAVSEHGVERYSCEINRSHMILGAAALMDDRWATTEIRDQANPSMLRLRVFTVPGERPATHGWTSARGSPAGTRQALP